MNANTLQEMMERYEEERADWIDCKGSPAGFDDWFHRQAEIAAENAALEVAMDERYE